MFLFEHFVLKMYANIIMVDIFNINGVKMNNHFKFLIKPNIVGISGLVPNRSTARLENNTAETKHAG